MSYHGVLRFDDGEEMITDSYDTKEEALEAAYEMESLMHQGNAVLLMSDPYDEDVKDDDPEIYVVED